MHMPGSIAAMAHLGADLDILVRGGGADVPRDSH
jgi:hypothetical protein